jgi:hypothetical protein
LAIFRELTSFSISAAYALTGVAEVPLSGRALRNIPSNTLSCLIFTIIIRDYNSYSQIPRLFFSPEGGLTLMFGHKKSYTNLNNFIILHCIRAQTDFNVFNI